jgi:hypothetical protein
MTKAELDAIPEQAMFHFREEVRDGQRYRIPVVNAAACRVALMSDDDPLFAFDSDGTRWRFTRVADGTLVKIRG